MDASAQERAGSEDDCPGAEAATVRGLYPLQLIALNQEPGHHALRKLEVRERLEELPHRALVEGAVALRPRRPHRRSLGAVQHPELNRGAIGGAAHDPAERVDLTDDGALRDPADSGIAAHLPDCVEGGGQQKGVRAEAGGHGGCFGAGVAAADNDDVVIA